MRIIKIIVSTLLKLAIIALVVGLVGREVLLNIGVSRLQSSLSLLRRKAASESYYQACRKKGSIFVEGDQMGVLQLRFVSSSEYVIEVLCSQYSVDPIMVEQRQLPPLVKKVVGNSGVIWGDERSGVRLEIYGRQSGLGVENQQIIQLKPEDELGIGPRASCVGYGYSCCQAESQQGVGQLQSKATDCTRSCYSSCVSRPVVLAFVTQPAVNQQTRTLYIKPGEEAMFSFVLDQGQAQQVKTRVVYGDGSSDDFLTTQGTSSHRYQCQEKQCQYWARIEAIDDQRVTTAQLPVNQIKIVVRP